MDAGNVKWVRLGDYIEQCDERNHSNKYGIEAIKGISTSHYCPLKMDKVKN